MDNLAKRTWLSLIRFLRQARRWVRTASRALRWAIKRVRAHILLSKGSKGMGFGSGAGFDLW